jgi:hypothetical protein
LEESLDKIIEHLEEEARMVLPGIQALFGFQLIAVFNQRFTDLSTSTQIAHFSALLCSALSVLLVLTPAAFHRQAEPTKVTETFSRVGNLLLTLSLLPLAVAIGLDLYVIGALIFDSKWTAALCSLFMFCALLSSWFIFPQYYKSRGHRKGHF